MTEPFRVLRRSRDVNKSSRAFARREDSCIHNHANAIKGRNLVCLKVRPSHDGDVENISGKVIKLLGNRWRSNNFVFSIIVKDFFFVPYMSKGIDNDSERTINVVYFLGNF